MARIILNDAAIEALLKLPETGAGFQLVIGRFYGNRSEFLVLNAEMAVDLNQAPEISSRLGAWRLGRWIANEFESPEIIISAPSVIVESLILSRVSLADARNLNAIGSRAQVPPSALIKHTKLNQSRTFYRYSPYKNDRRVDATTGDFLPGTYCSPDSENPLVPSGFAAVGRFALPSSLPASFQYQLTAPADTAVYFGTVAPAFGQAGGGVEAMFPNGARNILPSPTGPTKIPDE